MVLTRQVVGLGHHHRYLQQPKKCHPAHGGPCRLLQVRVLVHQHGSQTHGLWPVRREDLQETTGKRLRPVVRKLQQTTRKRLRPVQLPSLGTSGMSIRRGQRRPQPYKVRGLCKAGEVYATHSLQVAANPAIFLRFNNLWRLPPKNRWKNWKDRSHVANLKKTSRKKLRKHS